MKVSRITMRLSVTRDDREILEQTQDSLWFTSAQWDRWLPRIAHAYSCARDTWLALRNIPPYSPQGAYCVVNGMLV